MKYLPVFLIAFIAVEHIYFLILEMFLWTKPKTMKIFGIKSKELAKETKVLAANQGLYNGFLAAGLILSLITKNTDLSILFLFFVLIAGLYGSFSTKKTRLFIVQGLPALIALLVIFFI